MSAEAELERVVDLIRETGGIDAVGPDDDFYEAGFASAKALHLLLELETAFSLSIPDDQFVESRTPRSLARMIAGLSQDARV